MAPTVKSRSARSASIVSPRSAVMSACQAWSAATTRQVPNSAESSKAWPPLSRPIAFAAAAGITGDGEVEIGHFAAQSGVANGATDDPGTLSRPAPAVRSCTSGAAARRSARVMASVPGPLMRFPLARGPRSRR